MCGGGSSGKLPAVLAHLISRTFRSSGLSARTALRRTAWTGAVFVAATVAISSTASVAQEPPESELDRGRQLHMQGERAAALVHYRAFLAQPVAPAADRATALNNICVLKHDLGEVQEALDACEQALALRRELGDDRTLSRTLNNYGLALQSSGRWDEARRAYLEALRSNRARDDQAGVAVNLANLGLLASDEGRYGLALDRHLEVEALAARHPDAWWAEEQRRVAWINRGVVYEKLGAYDQALELYQKLVTEQEQLGPRRWATVQLNLGTVYRNLGDPHQAASAYRRAAELFEREDDRAGLSSSRLNLGQVLHANLQRTDEAEAELRLALDLARESGDRGIEIQALFLLGELYLEGGADESHADAARSTFVECLELARSSGSAEGEWWALYGLGRLAAREDRLNQALAHLGAALDVLERTRARVADRDLRGGFFTSWRHVYETAVNVLWRRRSEGDALQAFSLVQRAKERELVEALGVDVRSSGAVDLESLRAALRGVSKSATLVEYFVTRDALHGFRLDASQDELRWWRGDPGAVRTARRVHAALASGGAPEQGDLRSLSSALFPGEPGLTSSDTISSNEEDRRLLVAPDGALRYLPFEVLTTPDEASGRLLDRYVLSYLPSSSALVSKRERQTEPRYSFVGLADPAPDAGSGLAAHFTERFLRDRLPSGRREIVDAAGRLPGEHVLLTDREATVAALRHAVTGGTRVLHLAAHALVDERPGGGAALVLAPVDGSEGDASDGLLGPSDLARLDLRTCLTVLAACRTALPTGDGPPTGPPVGPARRPVGRAAPSAPSPVRFSPPVQTQCWPPCGRWATRPPKSSCSSSTSSWRAAKSRRGRWRR